MTKHLPVLSALVILCLLTTLPVGCGSLKPNQPPNTLDKQNGAEPFNQPESTDLQDAGNKQDSQEESRLQTGTGIYQGQIDNHSIEIEVHKGSDKVPTAFQLTGELRENFANHNLNTGDKVTFSYETPQVGQPILTEITKQN